VFSLTAPEVQAYGLPSEVIDVLGQYVPVIVFEGRLVPVVTVSGNYSGVPLAFTGEFAPVETIAGVFAETLQMTGAIKGS
jgi:hypothetical protein